MATPRNHQFDGLRGYAAMAVVVYHAILSIDTRQIERILSPSFRQMSNAYDVATKLTLAVFNGEVAVVIFFIMSGAVLLQSLQRETGHPAMIATRFVIRRILRIYPVLIVCLILAALIFASFGLPSGLGLLLRNLTLAEFPLLGASWTLQVEMAVIPLLLVGGFAFRKWREVGLLIFLVAALALQRHTPLGKLVPQASWFALCFAFGMLIPTACGAFVARFTPSGLWPVFLLVALLVRHVQPLGLNTNVSVQFAAAALFVNAVYYGRARVADRVLGSPRAVFFGRISYTLYLANALFLEPIGHRLSSYPPANTYPLEAGLMMGLVVILLTIPTAYLLTLWVEEPAIRWGRRLTKPAAKPAHESTAPRVDLLPASHKSQPDAAADHETSRDARHHPRPAG